jgi:tight adherence protein C
MIDTLTNPENILAAIAALVCFATIVTLAAPMMNQSSLAGRLKSVANRREELRRRSREAIAAKTSGSSLRHTDEGMSKKVVERLQLSRLLEDPKVVEKLAQAGFRGPSPVTRFYFFRMITPIVLFVLVGGYLVFVNDFGLTNMHKVVASVGALVAGYYAPNIYISNIAEKRRGSIMQAFPDALDLLLICVESGMSIEAALQKVSQEIGPTSIELAEELTLLVAELSYLPERRLAYEGLAKRTNHPGVKSVATAMIQAERYGTPLGTALRVMAKENRELRLAAAEKKAAALPAKLTVPMILFFLPVLFIAILGPAIVKVQDTLMSGNGPQL